MKDEEKNKDTLLAEIRELREQVQKYRQNLLEQRSEHKKVTTRYEDFYENAPDMFVSVDSRTQEIIHCNQTLAISLQYPKEELLGEHISKVYHPDSKEERKKVIQKFLDTGHVRNAELQLIRKDGTPIDVSLNISAVRNDRGEILYSRSIWRDISRSKQIQSQLLKSTQLASLGSWDWDLIKDQAIWSEEFFTILGLDQETTQPSHQTFLKAIHPEDRHLVEEELRLSLDTPGHDYAIEFRIVRPNKEIRFIRSQGEIQRNAKQQATQMFGIFQDLTAQRHLEDRFTIVFNASPVGLILSNHKGDIVLANNTLQGLLGYTQEELLDEPVEKLLPRRCQEQHACSHHEYLRSPSKRTLREGEDLFSLHKDGSEIPVEIALNPVTIAGESFVLSSVTDIRRRLGRQQRDAQTLMTESKFRMISEFAPVMIDSFDRLGNCVLWNQQCQTELGYTQQEITDHPDPLALFYPDPDIRQAVLSSIQKADGTFREYEVRCKKGELRSQRWADFRLPDNSIISIGYDITALKNHEKELETARQEAEMANKAKSRFLANMSHEIRTPMGIIVGLAQILLHSAQKQGLSGAFVKQLENLQRAGASLTVLLNDILDLSKIEAGKIELHLEELDTHQLLKEIHQLNRLSALAKDIQLELNLEPTLPTKIYSDRSKLHQILLNLMGNAIKFTPPGKTIQLLGQGGQSTVLFQIIDQGIGIARNKFQTVFETFEQADNTTTRRFGGTGLGLTICKDLVTLLGGSIHLESALGKGSTFSVEIPLALAKVPLTKNPPLHKKPDTAIKGKLILLVEDDPITQEMMLFFFEEIGVRYQLAVNGIDGVQKALEIHPDLILMDMHMPEMNGSEAIRHIRSHQDFETLPIIVLSADAFSEQEEQARTLGITDYLTKPIDLSTLLATLSQHLTP